MAKFKATTAIFDLDNTLYSENDYFSLTFPVIAERLSFISGRTSQEIEQFIVNQFRDKGSKYPRFFEYILKELNVFSNDLDQEILLIYKTVTGELTMYSEATALLDSLQGRVKTGLITNGIVDAQANKVRLLGIQPYFDHICYARSWGIENEKPSIIPYSHTLDALSASPASSVYVGDDPVTDIAGARSMGMFVIRVRKGEFADMDCPSECAPDLELNSLSELANHVVFGTTEG